MAITQGLFIIDSCSSWRREARKETLRKQDTFVNWTEHNTFLLATAGHLMQNNRMANKSKITLIFEHKDYKGPPINYCHFPLIFALVLLILGKYYLLSKFGNRALCLERDSTAMIPVYHNSFWILKTKKKIQTGKPKNRKNPVLFSWKEIITKKFSSDMKSQLRVLATTYNKQTRQ